MKREEYDFVLQYVDKLPKGSRILDAGCGDCKLVGLLCRRKYDAYGVELGIYPDRTLLRKKVVIPKSKIRKEDVRQTSFPDRYFDVIFCLSTLVNVGLGGYGDEKDLDTGDINAMKEFIRILKDDGVILLTVAYGTPGFRGFKQMKRPYRVYDKNRLNMIFKGLEIVDEHYYYWDTNARMDENTGKWRETGNHRKLIEAFPICELDTYGNAHFVLKKVV